jgi:outer membrane protein W
VLAVVALGIQGARAANATNQYIFGNRQMRAMPAAESAFDWLSDHARPNDTVVNDPTLGDDATWMYADAGVRPLFATRAGDGNVALNLALTTPDLSARARLAAHVDLLGSNASIDALARHYHARWIYFGQAAIFPYRGMQLSALRGNRHLRQVFQLNGVHVFQINLPRPPK